MKISPNYLNSPSKSRPNSLATNLGQILVGAPEEEDGLSSFFQDLGVFLKYSF